MEKASLRKIIIICALCIVAFLGCELIVSSLGINNRLPWINVAIFSALGLMMSYYAGRMYPEARLATGIITASYILRVIVCSLGIHTALGSHLLYYYGDDLEYLKAATQFYETGEFCKYTYYSVFLTGIMYLFGTGRLVMQIFNVYMYVAVAAIMQKIMKRHNVLPRIQTVMLVVMSIFPIWGFLCVSLNRDSFIIASIALSLNFFDRWISENGSHINLVYAVLALAPAVIFHTGCMFVLVPYIVVFALYDRAEKRFAWTRKTWIMLGCLVLVAIAIVISVFTIHRAWEIYYYIFAPQRLVFDLNVKYDYYGYARSNYLVDVPRATFGDLVKYFPLRMIYFFLSPLPTEWYGIKDVMSFVVDSLFYLAALVMALWHMIKNKKANVMGVLYSIICVTQMVVFALAVWNCATAMRHRCKLLAFAVAVIAYVVNDLCVRKGIKNK